MTTGKEYRLQVWADAGLMAVQDLNVLDDDEAIEWAEIIRSFNDEMGIVRWRLWDMRGECPRMVDQSNDHAK